SRTEETDKLDPCFERRCQHQELHGCNESGGNVTGERWIDSTTKSLWNRRSG
ncbi:hypothetical protein BaRGS_00009014, partial [Batillaria attramentaria]